MFCSGPAGGGVALKCGLDAGKTRQESDRISISAASGNGELFFF